MKDFLVKADIYRLFSEIFSFPEDEDALKVLIKEVSQIYEPLKELDPPAKSLKEDFMPFMKGEIPLSEGAYASYNPADVVAFYKAFGLKPKSGDNPDSLTYILQFLSILSLKVAMAPDDEKREIAFDGYSKFLNEHLNYWIDKFRDRVHSKSDSEFYKKATDILVDFIKREVKYVDSVNSKR